MQKLKQTKEKPDLASFYAIWSRTMQLTNRRNMCEAVPFSGQTVDETQQQFNQLVLSVSHAAYLQANDKVMERLDNSWANLHTMPVIPTQ